MVGTISAYRNDGGKNDEERRLVSYEFLVYIYI